MGQDNREWSWVGEDGTEHPVDEDELSFALSSEELPAYTLVCKKGWGEWLPAMQVAELLWALPAGRSDNPRKPAIGRKPAPPLERYPKLKQRAADIASGAIDPAAESSLGLPAIMVKPRSTVASKPDIHAEVPRARNRMMSLSDGDEPTLQLDVEALDQAFENLQAGVGLGVSSRSPTDNSSPPPAVPRPKPSAAEEPVELDTSVLRSAPPAPAAKPPLPTPPPGIPRRPLRTPPPGSAARQPIPTPPPGSAPRQPFPTPPPGSVPRSPLPTPAPDGRAAPPRMPSAPSWPSQSPLPPAFGNGAGTPSATPWPRGAPLEPDAPRAPPRRWPWLMVAAIATGSAGAWWINTTQEPEPEPIPVALPTTPEPKPEPPKMACSVKATPTAVAGWAHVNVRPVLTRAPGLNKIAVGYAQTSKLAVGLVLDTLTLAAEKPYSYSQNSPLLSVVPVTTAMGQRLEFLESRAASTLQSAIFVPARSPFAVGLSSGAVAVRLEGEADRVVWRPPWETISVPATARLDANTHAVVLRAGGERGSMLLGKLTEQGKPIGELREIAPGTDRLGQPTVTTSENKIAISFDAGLRGEPNRSAYLGISELPELPARAQPVLTFDDEISAVGAVALPNKHSFVQYTRGELTKQRVLGQVLDQDNQPVGDPIEIAPKGEDSYNGELYSDGSHILVTYLVRDGNNHEFWATSLKCAMTP